MSAATANASATISEATVETHLLSGKDLVEGNVDYRGQPAKRVKSGRWRSACFIIGVEMAERFAFNGVGANLITYLTGPLGQSTSTAAENVNTWSGTAHLLPLFGAFVGDSLLGRYRTIVLASLLYILALGLLTLTAVLPSECQDVSKLGDCSPHQLQIVIFFVSLYLFAMAQGMHKPCVQAFGADQFDEKDPEEAKAKSSFFNWWYFSLCVAVLVTLVILTYIQENLSWGLGFGIPCIVMGFAVILFLSGTMTYRFRVNSDKRDPFLRIGFVFVKAARNWRNFTSSICMEEDGQRALPNLGSQQFEFLNKALAVSDGSEEGSEVSDISEVEEAKTVLRLLPILTTCLVYGIVYSQSSTLCTKQGVTMDRSITPSFQVPAASLQSFIVISIIVFITVYDQIIVPVARYITGKPSGITTLQRIGTGLFISILTMITAALVESKRLEIARKYGLVDKPNATVPMSVIWLVPQYTLLGVSEVFTMVGLQEFFYNEMPAELKSTGLALYLSILGVGGFLSSFLISMIDKATGGDGHDSWISDNLNKGHLDYFYWLLAILSAVAFFAFLFTAKSYIYNRVHT
ncbi:OLC1v1015752C1 [Oldenlandia corymbosa var. corymbosa]|uniref:OLC1v1015752C1 n=1 Tax=Oldenlandia corymbosa var. corymbosa TaxID=529605 RepID=A0AAV1E4F4_OLDCO|nr:OLC1v1015752C1 [Oldenlandia corymbosa var. corymbosa]